MLKLYENLSATEIGLLVNTKKVKPKEILQDTFDRIEKVNPQLNVFTYTKYEEAMKNAEDLETAIMQGVNVGPLAGVPVALKDFLPAKKGWTATHGGVKSFVTVDTEDCTFWKAAQKLGCIAIGKTNAPSFGFRGTTYNKMYGNTNNPFNLEYNSGGSSGGSCAAVGSLLVPLASCGDAGGSTRCPSAWCNTFGFKPSAGLVPSVCRPDAWAATHPYCCDGPTSRTVLDSALIMERMMEYDPKDPISVPLMHKPFSVMMHRSLKGKKIAVTHDYDIFPNVDPQIKTAVDSIADVLKNEGAVVDYVHFKFNYSLEEMEESWLRSISVDSAVDLELMKQNGFDLIGDHAEDLPDQMIKWVDIAFNSTMMDYRKFHDIRTDILDANLAVLKDYDIIISPVTSCMPVKNEDEDTKGPSSNPNSPGSDCEELIGFCQTWLQNMTGNPAASVPAGLGEDNLPIGVQVVGRRYFDEDVFAVASTIERCLPWKDNYREIAV